MKLTILEIRHTSVEYFVFSNEGSLILFFSHVQLSLSITHLTNVLPFTNFNKLNIDLFSQFFASIAYHFHYSSLSFTSLFLSLNSKLFKKKCRQSLLAAISDGLLAPFYQPRFHVQSTSSSLRFFWLSFRAFIAFGYFFHGFGLFNMSKTDLWVLYFFYFSRVVDCTLQYALHKAPAWAEKKFIGKPFFTLSLELPSLLTGSLSSLPVGITLVSSCSITGPLFSP